MLQLILIKCIYSIIIYSCINMCNVNMLYCITYTYKIYK